MNWSVWTTTHVYARFIHKGLLWAILNPTLSLILGARAPLCFITQQVLLPSTTTDMYDQHPEETTHRWIAGLVGIDPSLLDGLSPGFTTLYRTVREHEILSCASHFSADLFSFTNLSVLEVYTKGNRNTSSAFFRLFYQEFIHLMGLSNWNCIDYNWTHFAFINPVCDI